MTTLTSEDVGELLRLHMEHGATWEQLAADEGCDAASLEAAVQQWEPGAKLSIRAGRARISNSPGRLDLDVLREQVEAGLSDEEIAEIHGVTAALVGLRRRERGIRSAKAYCGTPRHLRLLPQVEAALRRLARPSTAAEVAEEAGVTGVDSVRRALAVMEEEGLAVCTHRPKSTRGGSRRWAAEGEPALAPAPRPEPEGPYAYMRGDSGEVMRGCIELRKKIKAHMDAQVTRPAEIPCAACRRSTPIPELRGQPGRLVCTTCAAQAPQPTEESKTMPPTMTPAVPTDRRTTPEEREERRRRVLELRGEGRHLREIAEIMGCPLSTVGSDLQRLGVKGHLPPGVREERAANDRINDQIRELLRAGARPSEVQRQTGASRSQVYRLSLEIRAEREAREAEVVRLSEVERLEAEIATLRNTLRETEEGAAELLEEVERLRAAPTAAAQLAALKEGVAQVERERLDLKRQLVEAQTAHTLAITAAETLQRQLDANPWRRAWELRRSVLEAAAALRAREAEVEAAREAWISLSDELEAVDLELACDSGSAEKSS